MLTLARGQKVKLADVTSSLQLRAQIEAQGAGLTFDFSCFGVDQNSKLSDDRYLIFYNQKTSPEGALQLQSDGGFALDLAKLPKSIQKLVFVATIDGSGTMANLDRGALSFFAAANEVARFELRGSDFGNEKAIMVAEVYLKDVWRLAAIGQGFAGGLDAVLKHFGGQEIEESIPAVDSHPVSQSKKTTGAVALASGQGFLGELKANTQTMSEQLKKETAKFKETQHQAKAEKERQEQTKVAQIPPPSVPKKVTLAKADSTFKIDLSKSAGEIVATAQWIDNGDRRSDNDDLDMRAGILFPDGTMSIVTCSAPGSLGNKPYVFHLGDVKSASRDKPGTEKMKVSPQISEKYHGKIAIVFSIYSAIANGPVAIASLKPVMELQHGDQTVKCELDFANNKDAKKKFVYTYVIGLAIIDGNQVEISPGGQVSPPASEATPWLEWDKNGGVKLTFTGPAVLKGGGKMLMGLLNAGNSKRYIQ